MPDERDNNALFCVWQTPTLLKSLEGYVCTARTDRTNQCPYPSAADRLQNPDPCSDYEPLPFSPLSEIEAPSRGLQEAFGSVLEMADREPAPSVFCKHHIATQENKPGWH